SECPEPPLSLRRGCCLHDAADHDAIGEHVVIIIVPLAGWARNRCAFENQGHRSFASARRPAPVIRMRVTSIRRPPATIRSMLAVASPALTLSPGGSVWNP